MIDWNRIFARVGRLSLVFLLILFSLGAQAQEDSVRTKRHPYLGLTVGFVHMKMKDQLVMPVRYRGTNFNFKLNYLKDKPRSLQEVYIDGVIGAVNTQLANTNNFGARFIEPRAQLYWGEIGYAWMRKMEAWSTEKYRFLLGTNPYFLMNVRYNERWDNSAINYEGAIAPLTVTGKVERDFFTKKDKKLTLAYSLNLPVLVFVFRPEFSGVPDFLDHERPFFQDLFERGTWESFWGFPRIKSTLDLTMPLSRTNLMKFTYKWDYYSYQEPVRTQFSGHSFLFTILTHL